MDPQYLFTDAQMRRFIANGLLTLKVDAPELHETIYRKTEEVYAKEGNPGNNILPRVPDVQKVFEHPVVRGGLTSLLGPDYLMHAHRHCHVNPPGSKGQSWHKDSYWGYKKLRYHRPRWVMIFYYPQEVTDLNGPSAVIPGTHYYMNKPADEEALARCVYGQAGTVTFMHFDLWHRASPNASDRNRYMMKFQFTRMDEPTTPTWNARETAWRTPDGVSGDGQDAVWSQVWDWTCGRRSNGHAPHAGQSPSPALLDALGAEEESVRLNAAYTLGALGASAVPDLIQALAGGDEPARLSAAYALGVAGHPAVGPLARTLSHADEQVRAHAVYALGDIGRPAGDAVPALADALGDPSTLVRHHAAEALGTVARNPATAVPALCRALRDEDGQVRFNASYALARFGPAASAAVPALREALYDDNRYARGHAAAALRRIGTPDAVETLLDFLSATRWCPITSKESTF